MLRWLRNPLPTLEAAARRFGDVFTMRMPMNPPFVVFSDPEAVKDIFTGNPDQLRAGEAAFILESVLGEHSLLLLDGQKHLRERRLMLPPFHGERMRSYGEAMEAWRSNCPRHPVWEDALAEGLIRVESDGHRPMRERRVVLTARGNAALAAHSGGLRAVAEPLLVR